MNFFGLILISLLILTLTPSSHSLYIECTYNKNNHDQIHEDFYWDVLKHAYTCDGKVTIENSREVSKIVSDHKNGKSNSDVHGLMIIYQRELVQFPRGIDQFFKHLQAIDLEACGLTAITAEDLAPFRHLKQISLDDNKITQLPNDLFKHNPKLQRIDFGGNPLLHVGPQIFKTLPELVTVFARHTTCTSENAVAFNRFDVRALELELAVDCPPTFEMMMSAILEDESFVKRVEEIVEARMRGSA